MAVSIPPAVRDALFDAIVALREEFPRARWVPRENWHVTVKFLGSVWPRLLDRVTDVIQRTASQHPPLESRLASLGAFPSTRRARVLWAGLSDPDERLAAIARSLDDALRPDFQPEKRAFTAHLTVARFEPPVALPDLVSDIDPPGEGFPIDHLVLYRSHLRRPAPVYEPLQRFSLGR